MRVIGLDIHRAFAEAVALEDGKLKRLGRVTMRRDLLEKFAASLSKDDIIVVEATGNAAAVAAVIGPHAKRVVIANPKQVRMIAHAKIKTDTIDAGVLAQLYASGFLPEVWIADEATQALRRQVTRRNQIVRQRSRLKNIIQSILHAHLIPSCPHQNLCGPMGRVWLAKQAVPEDERLAIERHLREFDRLGEDLKVVERDLARSALADESIKRLMTIPGIHMIVALAIKAAVGDVKRFPRPQKLVSYLGLNPSIRQSGPGPAYHGRITKQGRGHARGMLVEAAWAAARTPGPLRAFFLRVRARRGQHVAAVATARKLAILIWHLLTKNESYLLARPALHARKLRDLELKAGHKPRAARRVRPMLTISAAIASRSDAGSSRPRRPTLASSPAGTREDLSQQPRRAQAPQMRSGDKGCAAGLSPLAPLFATRSPMRAFKDSADPAHFKNLKSATVWI
jgi:transposase